MIISIDRRDYPLGNDGETCVFIATNWWRTFKKKRGRGANPIPETLAEMQDRVQTEVNLMRVRHVPMRTTVCLFFCHRLTCRIVSLHLAERS